MSTIDHQTNAVSVSCQIFDGSELQVSDLLAEKRLVTGRERVAPTQPTGQEPVTQRLNEQVRDLSDGSELQVSDLSAEKSLVTGHEYVAQTKKNQMKKKRKKMKKK